MLEVRREGIILEKTELSFEEEAVLNPAIMREDDIIHLFYRAVRNNNHSTIGYCKLGTPLTISERRDKPILSPEYDYESRGVEDPRIVKIDNLYYLTYTAYDGLNALGSLATSSDLEHFHKVGLMVPQIKYEEFKRIIGCKSGINNKYFLFNREHSLLWDKNVIFFPRKINGKLYFLHRIKPDIQIVSVNTLGELTKEFWEEYLFHIDKYIVLSPKYKYEESYVGGGCPPIETKEGWLLIYHGVCDTIEGYVYSAFAALLDLNDPQKEIARLPYPLFRPEYWYELVGEVNNVCFPTGTALFGDTLYIYYGAADEHIACVSVSLSALLTELLHNTDKK
jgi:predicted GH43/DUF377 family glycosyl hydrolase